jgi:hypothetical protein
MKYALDVLDNYVEDPRCEAHCVTAINFLRQAIAEAEKREWVGLTDEEIKDIREDLTYDDEDFNQLEFARDIEAKLKKKNVPQP